LNSSDLDTRSRLQIDAIACTWFEGQDFLARPEQELNFFIKNGFNENKIAT